LAIAHIRQRAALDHGNGVFEISALGEKRQRDRFAIFGRDF